MKKADKKILFPSKSTSDFPVVGIGASAGGLEALEAFFHNTAVKSGMAYIVIQHLDPNRVGILPELLQRVTKIKITEALDETPVMPDCVYVIPHNKNISISHGILRLSEPVIKDGLRLPIDFFFHSLAEDMGTRAVGVILSGMGSDGSLGLLSIKERSGITAVQNPDTAKFDSMPRSAEKTVLIDINSEAKNLPGLIAELFKKNYGRGESREKWRGNINSLDKIMIMLRQSTGNDFSMYKNNMIHRRIERRMSVNRLSGISQYAAYMQKNPDEVKLLFKELLIGVTSFFRDPKTWDSLQKKVLPEFIMKNPSKTQLRAWVPACSTGEEAYSLAILFTEVMENLKRPEKISLQIFATDIDAGSIDKARKGLYDRNITADVSQKRIKRFFKTEKNGYQVNREIRDMIVFAPQNVVKDPPFTKIDIISCRNLMIYFDAELQKSTVQIFKYSINPGGILLLGSAETVSDSEKSFVILDNKNKIYRSRSQNKKSFAGQPDNFFTGKSGAYKITEPAKSEKIRINRVEQIILQQYSPAGVLVNTRGDILYISGHTGRYLEPASGQANWNILTMLHEGLRVEFARAFRKVINSRQTVTLRDLKIDYRHAASVSITVKKLDHHSNLKETILVVFSESAAPLSSRNGKVKRNSGVAGIKELKYELRRTRDNLKANDEEMQTSQEELRSVNEELQSNLEELQSTNEELTTSKEEMQSLNEELQTVNTEMQSKIVIYENANNDLKNLINSTEIAVLFLDKNNCITQFTFSLTKIFNIRQTDVGRPFSDLSTDILYSDIIDDLTEVLRSLIFVEKEIPTRSGLWFRVRIMPYRTIDDRIEGTVITFTDISFLKQLEARLMETELKSNTLMNAVTNIIISLDNDGTIRSLNRAAEKFFSLKETEVLGKDYYNLLVPQPARKDIRACINSLSEGSQTVTFKTEEKGTADEPITLKWQGNKITDAHGLVTGVIIVGPDRSLYEK
jgi:two-component system CheB/CheR fusion protein